MKTALILVLTGAIFGVMVASFLVPPMLSWYAEPGGLPQGAHVQAVVNIPEVVRYVTSRLLWGQAIGGGMGALLGLVIYFVTRGTNRGRAPSPSANVTPSVEHKG